MDDGWPMAGIQLDLPAGEARRNMRQNLEAGVKQDRQIYAADEALHDPFLARISALDALPSEHRLKWIETQSATLRAARLAVASSRKSPDELLNCAHVAIIDAQLRCLSQIQNRIVAESSVR